MAPMQWLAVLCELACAPFGIEPPLHRRRLSFFKNNRAFRVEKARQILGYEPKVSLQEGIRRTIRWYRRYHDQGGSMREMSLQQIAAYEAAMSTPGVTSARPGALRARRLDAAPVNVSPMVSS